MNFGLSISAKFCLFFFFMIQSAFAHFEFSPITISMTTSGKSSHSIAQVINRSNETLPIIIKVTERKLLENGNEDRPETKELTVFPNQFLLAPKETKMIKISWQGNQKIPNEQSYRIIVEEVPVEFSPSAQGRGSVRIMINYVGSIYVNSDSTTPKLNLDKIEILKNEHDKLSLLFNNVGTSHAIIKNPVIELTAKKLSQNLVKKITLEKKQLELINGKNVLAKSLLRINIPIPNELIGYDGFEWNFTYEK